ncbi:MAG: hypothetical protein AB1744_16145 [Candidatus Zixiibacteriota bacterium]
MRKLVLLVGVTVIFSLACPTCWSGAILPSWEAPSGNLGIYPISNEISFYKNVDDSGEDRGQTLQLIFINSFKIFTDFTFEFTGDFNWRYSYVDPSNLSLGKNNHDYYLELSLVKPLTSVFSLNVQRISATFEAEPINQFGIRISL